MIWKKKINKPMTFGEFLILGDCIKNIDSLYEAIKNMDKPLTLCGVTVPNDLNGITFGQYVRITQLKEGDMLTEVPRILLDVDVMNESVFKVLSFDLFASKEIARISQLFASTRIEPTQEEKEAGIDEMNSGIFGVIDWFALRMGISHDDVENISWMKVYKCLDMEAQKTRFNRRLRDVMDRRSRKRK